MPEIPSPAAPQEGHAVPKVAADDALLARIIPLWIGKGQDGVARPTLMFGTGTALVSATTANSCTGAWQLHLFSFSYEARQALQTIRLLFPGLPGEAASRATGEGLLLIKVAEGAFDCRIVDRRGARGLAPPLGSWQFGQAVARQAALHIPPSAPGRAKQAARHVVSELSDPSEKAEVCALMGCKSRLDDRPYGKIRLDEVLAAANGLLEPAGLEVTCSDRRVLSFIDAFLAAAPVDVSGMVDRIAHELVAELAEKGGIG